MKVIYIHKGDDTIFANVTKFLTFELETLLDLTDWTAEFSLGRIVKNISDISFKNFEVVLTADETNTLLYGEHFGCLKLTDANGNIKTIANMIPFIVTSKVVENQAETINLTVPESSEVNIKVKVGAEAVTSVNGMTGDVVLDIPDTSEFALKSEIPDVSNLATKDEIPTVPTNLSEFKNDVGYTTEIQVSEIIKEALKDVSVGGGDNQTRTYLNSIATTVNAEQG